MAKKLSNIAFMPAVESVSRKFALRRETCTNKEYLFHELYGGKTVSVPGKTYMGSVARTVSINGLGPVTKNIFFMRRPMDAPEVTDSQRAVRTQFAMSVQWATLALKDLSYAAQNAAKYREALADFHKTICGVSAAGFQSYYGWLKAVAYAYGEQHEGSMPSTHALPAFDA